MENQKFLSEEKFQHTNKKVRKVALAIFLTGLAISIGLVIFGTVEKNQQKQDAQVGIEAAANRLDEMDAEISDLRFKAEEKRKECSAMVENGASVDERAKCNREKDALSKKARDIELGKMGVESEKMSNKMTSESDTTPMQYTFAFQVILISSALAGGVFMMSKRREIGAYTAQQGMPVAQEMIEKMTPTAAKSSGVVAESVAEGLVKGYHKGMKEEEKAEPKDEKKSENQE